MSIVTFDRALVRSAEPRVARRGFWARFLDRMIEARQRQAREQIRRHHRFAFPRELNEIHWNDEQSSENPLPFVR